MLNSGPSGPSAAPEPGQGDDGDEADEEPRVPGMQRTTPEAAAALEQAAAEKRARETDPDSSGISDERLRELKEGAKARIEARLVARRKQRRLLRGGDLPKRR